MKFQNLQIIYIVRLNLLLERRKSLIGRVGDTYENENGSFLYLGKNHFYDTMIVSNISI